MSFFPSNRTTEINRPEEFFSRDLAFRGKLAISVAVLKAHQRVIIGVLNTMAAFGGCISFEFLLRFIIQCSLPLMFSIFFFF